MSNKSCPPCGEVRPRLGRPPKYDYRALVLWWEGHGKPSPRVMGEALGIPQHAARIALRDHPEYGGWKMYAGRPKDHAQRAAIEKRRVADHARRGAIETRWAAYHVRRAAIVTWWREHGKPRLLDVAWEFGITRERARQILCGESDYDRCKQGAVRQKVQDTLDVHPEWSAVRVALETGCSHTTVRSIARNMGHKLPEYERPAYKPRGRVRRILELHLQGLHRPEIAERLGIQRSLVHIALKRALALLPEYSKIPIVDGRRFRGQRVSDRLLDIKTGEPPAT